MRYLIYCGPGIGDFIIALPMAAAIKKYDQNSYIKMITTSSKSRIKLSKSLLNLQNYVDEIDYYSNSEKLHSFCFLLHNGYKKYDYGFVIQYTANKNTSVLPSKIIRIASKMTCGMKVPTQSEIKYDYYIDYIPGTKISDYPMLMLDKVGVKYKNKCIPLLNEAKISCYLPPLNINKQNKTISLCLGTANVSFKINGQIVQGNPKNWPYKYWIELAKTLASQNYNVLLLGGLKEKNELGEYINELKVDNIYNYVGDCTIEQSLALIQVSDLVVGADTGMMHCSGALLKPSITLFGCTDHHEYLPFGERSYHITVNEKCSPCFGTKEAVLCRMHQCMEKLSPEKVMEKINTVLK